MRRDSIMRTVTHAPIQNKVASNGLQNASVSLQ